MAEVIGTFYEFFAGGGMARAGLGPEWQCVFANDFDRKKSETYRANWGVDELVTIDVASLSLQDLPEQPDLVWASFPCQDLSLAGGGAGLKGERSGTFWPFWRLISAMRAQNAAPAMIVLENVCGTLTSHGGSDFQAICKALAGTGYRFGAIVVDASLFVPQSRPRLFIVAVMEGIVIPTHLLGENPASVWHPLSLRSAYHQLPIELKSKWCWWQLPLPPLRSINFADIIQEEPEGVEWYSKAQTLRLLELMSPVNSDKVVQAQRSGRRVIGTVYRRTRHDEFGRKVQRAEVRFDDIAGCLRTPAGGSSRQVILVVQDDSIRARLISARETARLMGLPESYILPSSYNEAYHLTGDGVVVPVVRHIMTHILNAIIEGRRNRIGGRGASPDVDGWEG